MGAAFEEQTGAPSSLPTTTERALAWAWRNGKQNQAGRSFPALQGVRRDLIWEKEKMKNWCVKFVVLGGGQCWSCFPSPLCLWGNGDLCDVCLSALKG